MSERKYKKMSEENINKRNNLNNKEQFEKLFFEGVKLPVKIIPTWMQSIGAGVFMSMVVDKNPSFKRKLKDLNDKVFLFHASDVDKKFYLFVVDGDVKVLPHSEKAPDVTMKGDLNILIKLLLGKIDGDTAFFNRKLELSGDTSTSVRLKNMLADL